MPRFLTAKPDARLIPLPWNVPLAEWPTERLVALPRGISRHVVRFIRLGDSVFAAKEVLEHLALHEYRLLRDLDRLGTPSVEPFGVVTGRQTADGTPLDPILITRHLQFSLPYRALFAPGVRADTVSRLLDAMVVLLARLHLIGFLWGDVSLSNTLFRRDAGSFAAYLVDAETGELHNRLSDGQRAHDLDTACTNLFGEFCDLESGGMLDESLDPEELVESISDRYASLWHELTGSERFGGDELHRIDSRVRRLNRLGFDVAELDIDTSDDGRTIRIQPKVVDAGHHTRRLLRLTGLDVEENQARSLLNDLDTYRVSTGQSDVMEAVVAHRWLTECYEAVISQIPDELRDRRDAPQLYTEILDHRWYLGERSQHPVGLEEATHDFISEVLRHMSHEQIAQTDPGRQLVNPFDPSQGFVDDTATIPVVDPWEEAAEEVDERQAQYLDIDALRRGQS